MRIRVPFRALALAAIVTCGLWAEVEDHQVIHKSLTAAPKLSVDNIFGSITVSGYDGNQVEVTAQQHIVADSNDRLADAKKEVTLDIRQTGDTLLLYVDGPFRDNCSDGQRRARRDAGYKVTYNFDVKVPRQTALILRTINNGSIDVSNVKGAFEVHNVNGPIEMKNIDGAGIAKTVNGDVKLQFARNPQGPVEMATINGLLDIGLQPNLSADLRMKNFHGDVFSDFEMTSRPGGVVTRDQSGSKHRFKADSFMNARVGNGGPEIVLNGFNSNIQIHKAK